MKRHCENRDQDLLFLSHGMLSFPKEALAKLHLRSCEGCTERTQDFAEVSRSLRIAFGGKPPMAAPYRTPRLVLVMALLLLLAAIGYGAYSLLMPAEPDACGPIDAPVQNSKRAMHPTYVTPKMLGQLPSSSE